MEETLLLLGPEARTRGVMIYKEWDKNLPRVMGGRHQIKQVFLNLLLNALQAMPSVENSPCASMGVAVAC